MVPADILSDDSVRLTACAPADLPTIARWSEQAEFLRLFDARPAYPPSEAALGQWLDERQKAPDAFLFALRRCDDDDLIGYIEIDGVLWSHQTGWLSIAIGNPDQRGRGYGYAGLRLALAFAFHELNLHRLQLTVFSYNRAAIALYEKLGFQREGVYREFLQRDGARHDMYLYGLLRREWEARRAGG